MSGTAQKAIRIEITAAVSARGTVLYERAAASSFGITREQFDDWLVAIGEKYLPPDANQRDAEDLLDTLRVADLSLARACAAGHERAWEQFMARFRELLYDSAL